VWRGYDGTHYQIFRAKPVTTPSIARSPNKNTVTVRRRKHVARWTLSAKLRDKDGTLIAGVRVYLQTSKNGKSRWSNTYRLKTNTNGQVSKKFSTRKRGTRYYRWYVPASPGYNKVYSARQKVQVKWVARFRSCVGSNGERKRPGELIPGR